MVVKPLRNTSLESSIARDQQLYTELTGLSNSSVDVKLYVKSVFGKTSPPFKAISGLKFTSPG
jgi:hypothetical protein